jgi:hypothetical protein
MFQSIPDVLCERFYTVVVGECGVAGAIQIVKTICKHKYLSKYKKNKNQINEDSDINFDIDFETEINNEGDDLVG